VDGEQTQTAVALLDEDRTELRAWKAEPLTTPSKPAALEDLRRVVRGITEELHTILADSGDSPPKAACFSLTGYMHDNDFVPSLVRTRKDLDPEKKLGPGQRREPLAGSLVAPSHRLQYLVGIVEGVGARVLYLIDYLLWRVVVLDLRYDLVLACREAHVRHVLLELAQVEIAQIAQVAKAHVPVPPVSLSAGFEDFSTHHALCQTNVA
jgi:hypothetical protein